MMYPVFHFLPVLAHGLEHHHEETMPSFWTNWPLEPGVLIPLAVSAALYYAGLWKLYRRSGAGHGIKGWEAWSFTFGWLSLFVALATPLHPLGSYLFSAHMAQHEILMLVAAPLLVLGKPLIAMLHAIPRSWANRLAAACKARAIAGPWHALTNPVAAWLLHGAVLWVWHLPVLFQATLTNDFIHALQHTSFLGSALLFWHALVQSRTRLPAGNWEPGTGSSGPVTSSAALGYGLAVLYMFTTALHSGALGALLTFTRTLWYPAYAHTTQQFGLTPQEDQQLGGLIMWIPACSIYILAGLGLFAAYLRESERRLARPGTPVLAPALQAGTP